MALTPKHMSLMVKNFSGRNALEWLNEYVVLEAKLMLNYTTMTIQEISYRLNFPTQSAIRQILQAAGRRQPQTIPCGRRAIMTSWL